MKATIRFGFEDEHVLVAWKPHGVLTSGNSGKTLRWQVRKATGLDEIEPCHRLDFATSGWIIFGKNMAAIGEVNRAFRNGRVRKKYWTICHGQLPRELRIKIPLDGKPSATIVQATASGTLAQSDDLTAAIVETLSGRTHQIRRHLMAAGHAIVGDDLFYPSNGIYKGRGLFLCAHHLTFPHPITGKTLDLKSLPSKKFTSIPWIHQVLNK